jgi:hypothetical protein
VVAFTNRCEKCYREMASSKVFLVRAMLAMALHVKHDSMECMLSAGCRMDRAKLTNVDLNYDKP